MKLNKKTTLISSVILSLSCATTVALEPKNEPLVNNVLKAFKGKNINTIAKLVSYPLEREAPLPAIKNEKEFIQRFNDVFDQHLLNSIVTSQPQKDWDEVGWRGIMLGDGDIWINYDGQISAINYQSPTELMVSNRLRAKGRRAMHRSVSQYAASVLDWHTKRFHIRVDELKDGQLRYTSWSKGKRVSEQPDLILHNGKLQMDGSGRNQSYVFYNKEYKYQLKVNTIGSSSATYGMLKVFKNGQEVGSEAVVSVGGNQ